MRWQVGLLAMVLVAAACGGESAETTTTALVEQPSTTSTSTPTPTVAETTTTTAEIEPVDICGKQLMRWEVGLTQTARCFFVPLVFDPVDDGWRTTRVDASVIWGAWFESADGTSPSGHFLVLPYLPLESSASIVESMLAIDGVHAMEGPVSVVVGGVPAQVLDLRTDPIEGAFPRECSSASSKFAVSGGPTEAVYLLVDEEISFGVGFGFGSCRPFRVWVFETEAGSVTVLWTPGAVDRFEELAPVADRLVGSIRFEAP